ncbi:MAG: Gfo/Idh/MocA family oxidoreductase [Oscillospiraceae bacterium]|nr:Gfo/Idh/MocA family oxidoreductase [Oscillospiraceae bacterium]
MSLMKRIRVIIIGAGNRGNRYATHMAEMPDKYQIVGMADPAKACRKHFQEVYGVPEEACYESWEEILAQPKMADVAVISTVDNMHYYPALQAIEKGYHLLLEKPVAQTAGECADIANAAREKGVSVLVCHVLRYTPFYGKIKELVMSGTIGQVVSIDQVEGIGNVHFSHSYVRGNWHSEAESTPMLLAKSCHDLDIIQWLLDKPCKRVSSFGSLTHFIPENAPEGAPVRCADGGCPVGDTCPYNCIHHYYDDKTNRRRKIITNGIAANFVPTDEEVLQALQTTDYGLCVYHAHNDVLDHQVVSMEFEGGATANLTVNAFNKGGRYIRIYGTKGEIYAHMSATEIQVYTFEDKNQYTVPVLKTDESINGGHGGGDEGIIRELYEYLSGTYRGFRAADITTSVKNHLIGFAAEQARHSGTVVNVEEVLKQYGLENA